MLSSAKPLDSNIVLFPSIQKGLSRETLINYVPQKNLLSVFWGTSTFVAHFLMLQKPGSFP